MILLQALVLNRIHIAGVGTPLLYIWLLLKENSGTSRQMLMLEAFVLGLGVDIFSDTWGMNAAAAVALAFVRPLLMRMSSVREEQEVYIPGVRTLTLELFPTSADLSNGLLRLATCSALTLACMAALENVARQKVSRQ